MDNENVTSHLFTGFDQKHIPYGMLTEVGAQQLILVGRTLRDRYHNFLGLDINEKHIGKYLYCRSTNMCRTLQSLRSFLYGMIDTTKCEHLPSIITRDKINETMFPQASGPCSAMLNRRNILLEETNFERSIEGYADLELKFKNELGYPDKVSWLTINEILTCYTSHNIPFNPPSVTSEDWQRVSDLCGKLWVS